MSEEKPPQHQWPASGEHDAGSPKTLAGEKTLIEWRQEIDSLDAELLRMLNQRAAIACEIALIKVAFGLPAYDPGRELQILERIVGQNPGPLDKESVAAIFSTIIHETRRLGTERMEKVGSR